MGTKSGDDTAVSISTTSSEISLFDSLFLEMKMINGVKLVKVGLVELIRHPVVKETNFLSLLPSFSLPLTSHTGMHTTPATS